MMLALMLMPFWGTIFLWNGNEDSKAMTQLTESKFGCYWSLEMLKQVQYDKV